MAEPPSRITLDEALASTLSHNPSIKLQKGSVRASEGVYRRGVGQFDFSIQSSLSRGFVRTPYLNTPPTEPGAPNPTLSPAAAAILAELYRLQFEEYRASQLAYARTPVLMSYSDSVGYSLGATQQSRFGPTFNPVLSAQHSDLHSNPDGGATGSIQFNINIPLLRGAGYQAVTANERAAKAQMQAARETLTHTTSQQLYATTAAYWTALGAEKSLNLARESEQRAAKLVEVTQALIAGGAQPSAQLQNVQANYESAGAIRIVAEQALSQAVQNLATAMGLDPVNLVDPPFPTTEFPRTQKPPTYSKAQLSDLIAVALNARADVRAAQRSMESSEILVVGAKNGLLPQLDLHLSMGFNGVSPGSRFRHHYASATDNLAGLNVLGVVSLELPVTNNAARGTYEQALGSRDQFDASLTQIKMRIGSDTVTNALGVGRAWNELSKRIEATANYATAVGNQLKLFKLGSATLVDVVTTQQNLSEAEQNEIQARVNLFVSLASLRFSIGALSAATDGTFTLSPAEISSAPLPSTAAQPKAPILKTKR